VLITIGVGRRIQKGKEMREEWDIITLKAMPRVDIEGEVNTIKEVA
jgi:hypothetical protein